MQIALFGREVNPDFLESFQEMIRILEARVIRFLVYEPFYEQIKDRIRFTKEARSFVRPGEIEPDTFCMISLGGDGTLLDTITLIQDSGIPVLGINTGRLGFLAAVSTDEVKQAATSLITGDFTLDRRSLISLTAPKGLFGSVNYALNELAVLKRDSSSMITISAYVDDKFLNTYWADGLIVATPTGSTGYSLSCGGPIISPDAKNFVITPIATHNLTVRPIVIPDECTIKLRISGRAQDYLVILDSRSKPLSTTVELVIQRAEFTINLVCIGQMDFFKTIRNKLAWGLDKRN
ncbi:MAG: NAD kinase [Bacteroidales bacterium]